MDGAVNNLDELFVSCLSTRLCASCVVVENIVIDIVFFSYSFFIFIIFFYFFSYFFSFFHYFSFFFFFFFLFINFSVIFVNVACMFFVL